MDSSLRWNDNGWGKWNWIPDRVGNDVVLRQRRRLPRLSAEGLAMTEEKKSRFVFIAGMTENYR
jgi:hypothetical protein